MDITAGAMQFDKGLGSKMDDIVSLLKERKAIISMTDEAIGLIDQHYKRLGGIYERRNGS